MTVIMVEVVHCRFSTNLLLSYTKVSLIITEPIDLAMHCLAIALLANVTIESSRFLMNSANKKGGVVYIAIESRVTG